MKSFEQLNDVAVQSKSMFLVRCDLYEDTIKDLHKFAMEFSNIEEFIEVHEIITVLKKKLEKLRNE